MMLALAVVGAFVLGGSAPESLVLKSDLDVWDMTIADLNGDSKLDLVAFCADSRSYPLEKGLAVYLADDDGRYAAEPSAILKLDPSIGTAFVAETDGHPPQEIVVVLTAPRLDNGDLLYDIEVLDGAGYASGGASSLFIDTVGNPLSPGSVAGVHRRKRRRRIDRLH